MKQKILLISTLCILSISALKAQEIDRRETIELGVKAGFNISNVWDTKGQEFRADRKAGFAGGIFLGIPMGKFFGIQPELLISQKGFKGSGSLLGFPYSTTRTTTYLDIPLQVQYKPSQFVTLLAGPQYSYLLNQKDKYTFGPNSAEQSQEFKNDNIRKNMLGFVAGIDLLYDHLVLSGRVGVDFQANNGDGTSNTPRYKNQWAQFTVGIKI